MLIRVNNDGTYCANWTPGAIGLYTIHVTIDGIEIGIFFTVMSYLVQRTRIKVIFCVVCALTCIIDKDRFYNLFGALFPPL